MKLRLLLSNDGNAWIVQRRDWLYGWVYEVSANKEKFDDDINKAQECAMRYAQRMLRPTIIEVK